MLSLPQFRHLPRDLTSARASFEDEYPHTLLTPKFFYPRRDRVDGKIERVGNFGYEPELGGRSIRTRRRWR